MSNFWRNAFNDSDDDGNPLPKPKIKSDRHVSIARTMRQKSKDPEWLKLQEETQKKRAEKEWNKKLIGNKNAAGNQNRKGKTNSEESNRKRSDSLKGIERHNLRGVPKPKETCPHCGKEGGRPQMLQFHFDKCKHKK